MASMLISRCNATEKCIFIAVRGWRHHDIQKHVMVALEAAPEYLIPLHPVDVPRHTQTTSPSWGCRPRISGFPSSFSSSNDLALLDQGHHRDAAILDGFSCLPLSLLLLGGVAFRRLSMRREYYRTEPGQLEEFQHLPSLELLPGRDKAASDGTSRPRGRSCRPDEPSDGVG